MAPPSWSDTPIKTSTCTTADAAAREGRIANPACSLGQDDLPDVTPPRLRKPRQPGTVNDARPTVDTDVVNRQPPPQVAELSETGIHRPADRRHGAVLHGASPHHSRDRRGPATSRGATSSVAGLPDRPAGRTRAASGIDRVEVPTGAEPGQRGVDDAPGRGTQRVLPAGEPPRRGGRGDRLRRNRPSPSVPDRSRAPQRDRSTRRHDHAAPCRDRRPTRHRHARSGNDASTPRSSHRHTETTVRTMITGGRPATAG